MHYISKIKIENKSMELVLMDPISSDSDDFHELINEPEVQSEFVNYAGQASEKTKQEIEYWVNNAQNAFPYFMRTIKLYEEDGMPWDYELVGFITNVPASPIERGYSGFKTLMNFAISEKYSGHGIMTQALQMTLDKMYDLRYNLCSAYVKQHNIASQRVLEKCGFDLVRDYPWGKTYVKALTIDPITYKRDFGII